MITIAILSLFVFYVQPNQKCRRGQPADPQQCQGSPVASQIQRGFLGDKYVARDDSAGIAKSDLHRGADASLVMSAHVVGYPDQNDWLSDVSPGYDQVEGKVLRRQRYMFLGEQDPVADCAYENSTHDEGITMTDMICPCRRDDRDDKRCDVDGDGEDLSAHGGPPQLIEYCGNEKGRAVPGIDHPDVHNDPFDLISLINCASH